MRVGLAVLQSLDADLLVVDRERGLVLADDRDERREVGALRQGLGELEAGARARRIGIHAEIRDAEAVFLAQRRRSCALKLGRLVAASSASFSAFSAWRHSSRLAKALASVTSEADSSSGVVER